MWYGVCVCVCGVCGVCGVCVVCVVCVCGMCGVCGMCVWGVCMHARASVDTNVNYSHKQSLLLEKDGYHQACSSQLGWSVHFTCVS